MEPGMELQPTRLFSGSAGASGASAESTPGASWRDEEPATPPADSPALCLGSQQPGSGDPGDAARGAPSGEGDGPVVMACVWGSDHVLGYALYNAAQECIYAGDFCDYAPLFLNLHSIKAQFAPAVIAAPANSDRAFLEALAQVPCPGGSPPELLRQRPADFAHEQARRRIYDLYSAHFPDEGIFVRQLSAAVNVRCRAVIRALGGLAGVLVTGSLPLPTGGEVRVGSITRLPQCCSADTVMALDTSTIDALRIFQTQAHPAAHQGLGKSKEGMSLFGLLNRCRTAQGRVLLRTWMVHPSLSLGELNSRQDAVQALASPQSDGIRAELWKHLRAIQEVPKMLAKFRRMKASVPDWADLAKHLQGVLQIHYIMQQGRAMSPIFREAADALGAACPVLDQLSATLSRFIDWTASQLRGRIVPLEGVSARLDHHRKAYSNLDTFLQVLCNNITRTLVGKLGSFPHETRCVYFPTLGYFFCVSASYAEASGTTDIDGLQFCFRDADWLSYSSPAVQSVNDRYGDLHGSIVDLELELAKDLCGVIMQDEVVEALHCTASIAKLDCVASLAQTARDQLWVRPKVVEEPVLNIEGGRNPLLEHVHTGFVPNPTDTSAGRIAIITGPNGSGKSVYIMQAATITYLAHIGSFVPARQATVGLTDRILTRTQWTEERGWGASSFSADVAQMNLILRYATARSLVVIDEFGKGTSAADGIGLLAASLKKLAKPGRGPDGVMCPLSVSRVLLATHFTEMLEFEFIAPEPPLLQVYHMEVSVQQAEGEAANGAKQSFSETPVFRYKLCSGWHGRSFALCCARAGDVLPAVVERAAVVGDAFRSGCQVPAWADAAQAAGREECLVGEALEMLAGEIDESALTALLLRVA